MDTPEENIYVSVVIACITIGVVIVYFIISILRHQKRIHELNRVKMLREFSILEGERLRISADLHDELGPLLSAIKLHINTIHTPRPQEELTIKKASKHIDEVVQTIREIAYNMMPGTLIHQGLYAAISEYIEKTMQLHQLNIKLSILDKIKLNKDSQINIYRIVQECVHNAVKHANATIMIIEINIVRNMFVLRVSDDGIGFDIDKTSQSVKGNGLRNLRSRAELFQGNFHMQSKPGEGVQYIFEIPVTQIIVNE